MKSRVWKVIRKTYRSNCVDLKYNFIKYNAKHKLMNKTVGYIILLTLMQQFVYAQDKQPNNTIPVNFVEQFYKGI